MPRTAPRALAALLALALAGGALVADAKTLRWAGRGDPNTMDPFSQNEWTMFVPVNNPPYR